MSIDTFTIDGLTFRTTLEPDQDAGYPWDNIESFGTVSHWLRRDKAPGERILNSDRRAHRFYDFAGAVASARRQGYSGPDAVQAVEREFQYFASWCNDQWQYVGVVVTLLDTDGNPTDEEDSIWGVDDDGDYAQTLAYDMALGIHTRIGHASVLTTEIRSR